jgi:hypothetical protein
MYAVSIFFVVDVLSVIWCRSWVKHSVSDIEGTGLEHNDLSPPGVPAVPAFSAFSLSCGSLRWFYYERCCLLPTVSIHN